MARQEGPSSRRAAGAGGRGLLVYAALAAIAFAACLAFRGRAAVLGALADGLWLIVSIAPLLVAAMLVAGYAQALVPRDKVAAWLGAQSGLRGLLLAALAGSVTPGGPFASFPLVYALYSAGADLGAAISYITAWSVLGIYRVFVWEVPLLGPEFAALRFLVSLPLPLLAGLAARALSSRLGGGLRREG